MRSKGLRQSYCKPCAINARMSSYKKNPKRTRILEKERAAHVKDKLLQVLAKHACVDCGEKDPVVLDFDHVRGKKVANVTTLARKCSWATVEAEIQKCEIVCANCHRRRTAKRAGWTRMPKNLPDYTKKRPGPTPR